MAEKASSNLVAGIDPSVTKRQCQMHLQLQRNAHSEISKSGRSKNCIFAAETRIMMDSYGVKVSNVPNRTHGTKKSSAKFASTVLSRIRTAGTL